ncbi:MAG: Flp pilus assembly complex ATPase component TadA [Planctomycetes bacterium]|nr:Flp pilus assembly complex ATPase component TadA [Planctomycetota bacterium]
MAKATKQLDTFDALLADAVAAKATDLLLVAGHPPQARIDGEFKRQGKRVLAATDTEAFARALFDDKCLKEEVPAYGFSITTRQAGSEGYARVAVSRAAGAFSLNARLHGHAPIPSVKECRLPAAAISLLEQPNGLVVVAGPQGSGKTTTLYSLVDWINQNRAVHICTVEKPRHYGLRPAKAIIQQREVGVDVNSYPAGIAAAMNQDLDVLMPGEIEDFETLGATLYAAETGHLVLTQLHGNSVGDALERLVEAAGETSAGTVRRQLAEALRGVVFQRLLRSVSGKGRVAVYEVMIPDDDWRTRVRNGETLSTLRGGSGSLLMREHLQELMHEKAVLPEDAKRLAADLGD